jgi:nitrous oxide reductase accessory protein NosL
MKKVVFAPFIAMSLLCNLYGMDMKKMDTMSMFQTVPKEKAILVQKADQKLHCARCGMNLVKFYKTSHTAKDSHGHQYQYCSIHCLEDHLRVGEKLKDIKVVDTDSLKFIDATSAIYVVGSDAHATMSHISKYAFDTKKDALAFQKEHGGKLMNFQEALNIAKKDFH